MIFTETFLKGSFVIDVNLYEDNRGWFFRSFCETEFASHGLNTKWVQHNHSFTELAGTLRGMHYQMPPYDEVKLIRCIAGEVYDVIIDLRYNSPTFLKWFGIKLSAENKKMIYVPNGFAHGFQALQGKSELLYQHSAEYTPGYERGISYRDEVVNIIWPKPITVISERDMNHPTFDASFQGIRL